MKKLALLTSLILLAGMSSLHGEERMSMKGMGMMSAEGVSIDTPVTLKEAKVVFRIDRVSLGGDNSFVLQQIGVLSEKLRQMGADSKVIAVFNGDGGFMLLNDMAYDKARKTTGGNPYKMMLKNLMDKGVEIEECGMTMMREGWVNKQLLAGVRVNTGANLRVIELVQKGFVALGQ